MMIGQYLLGACENVDAAVFSGDLLFCKTDGPAFREYVARWVRAIEEHDRAEGVRSTHPDLTECKQALLDSKVALDDWVNTFAPELCNASKVDESLQRIADQGGTVHYVATVNQRNTQAITLIERGDK